MLLSALLAPAFAADGAAAPEEEDEVTKDQSVDGYTELEDAQPGTPGHVEGRLWLTYGYVPAEGFTPSYTIEGSYTGKGLLKNTEFDLNQYFEHDDVDNSIGVTGGWMQRWVKDGGRKSAVPSIGTLVEYYLRVPGVISLPDFAPGATVGDHLSGILTVAKYLGPGSLYLNGEVQHQFFNSQICTNEEDVAYQPDATDVPDKSPDLPNYDGCDYWAPWTFVARIGYQFPIKKDKLTAEVDFTHETNEFTTQVKSDTNPDPEIHYPYEMGNVSLTWHATEHWSFSPGVLFGLDGHEETPSYEAGLFILLE